MVDVNAVRLRCVWDEDLDVFYEQQRDPEATRMAAFPARERQPFMEHWAKMRADPTVTLRTVLDGDQVAGNVVSWAHSGQQEVGYWLGRAYWGRGIASRALERFLPLVPARPLYAHVASHNIGSMRVLEKCGFQPVTTSAAVPAVRNGTGEVQFVLLS
jgi:RimJ/RimL family protein N-acetyltransferase